MVAETKLYDALSIPSSASQDEIKRAYRKAALKHHPDKNKNDPKAGERFKDVSQAYEILSDPEKRKTYDQYGLDFILRGGPAAPDPNEYAGGHGGGAGFGSMPGGGFSSFGGMPGDGGTRTFHFNMGGGGPGSGGGFSFSNPEDIFRTFMGGAGGGGGAAGGFGDDDDIFASFGGMGGMPGPGGRPRGAARQKTPEVTVVEKPLLVSLEDIFNGTTKKLKINRKTYDAKSGKQSTESKILEVPIKKGLRAGSKIKFTNVGDQIEGGTQDIHFTVEQKPHGTFTRDGDDLKIFVDLSLKEALTGWQRTVETIDGKKVPVSGSGPTKSEWVEKFPGLGMPKSKKIGERGDLIVGVRIKFPESLSAEQKRILKETLP